MDVDIFTKGDPADDVGSTTDRSMTESSSTSATHCCSSDNHATTSELDSLKEARVLIHKHREKMKELLYNQDDELITTAGEKEHQLQCEYCGCHCNGSKSRDTGEKSLNIHNLQENEYENVPNAVDDRREDRQSMSDDVSSTTHHSEENKTKASENWNKLRVALLNAKSEKIKDLHSEMDMMRQLVRECCVENEALLEEGGVLVDENEALAKELEEVKRKLAMEEQKNKSLKDKVEELEIELEETHAIANGMRCNDLIRQRGNEVAPVGSFKNNRRGSANSEADETSGEPEESGPSSSLKCVAGLASKFHHKKNSQEFLQINGCVDTSSVPSTRRGSDNGPLYGPGKPSIQDPSQRRHSAAKALEVKDWSKDDFKMAYEIAKRDLAKKHKELDRERRHSLVVFKKQQSEVEALQDVTYFAVEEKKSIAEQKKKCEKIIKACPTCKQAYTLMLQQQQLEEQERKNALLLKQVQETAMAKEKAEQAAKLRQQQQLLQSSSAAAALRRQNSRCTTSNDVGLNNNSGHGSVGKRSSGRQASSIMNLNLLGGTSQHAISAKSNDLSSHRSSAHLRARGSGMSGAALLNAITLPDEQTTSSGADPLANGALRMRAKRMSCIALPKHLSVQGDSEMSDEDGASDGEDQFDSEPGEIRDVTSTRNGLSSDVMTLLNEDAKDPEGSKQEEKTKKKRPVVPRNGLSLELMRELEAAAEETEDVEVDLKEGAIEEGENEDYEYGDELPKRDTKTPSPQSVRSAQKILNANDVSAGLHITNEDVFSTNWLADGQAQDNISPLPHDCASDDGNGQFHGHDIQVREDAKDRESDSSSAAADQQERANIESHHDDEPSLTANEEEDSASVSSNATARRRRRGMLPDHPLLLGGLRHRLAPKNNSMTLLDVLNKDRRAMENRKDDEGSSFVSDFSSACGSVSSKGGRNRILLVGRGRRQRQEETEDKGMQLEEPGASDMTTSASSPFDEKPRKSSTMGNLLRSAQRNQKMQSK